MCLWAVGAFGATSTASSYKTGPQSNNYFVGKSRYRLLTQSKSAEVVHGERFYNTNKWYTFFQDPPPRESVLLAPLSGLFFCFVFLRPGRKIATDHSNIQLQQIVQVLRSLAFFLFFRLAFGLLRSGPFSLSLFHAPT